MKYQFVAGHRSLYSVEKMCKALEVSRSGYYAWRKRSTGRRQVDRRMRPIVKALFDNSRQNYGSYRIWYDMRSMGWKTSPRRIARLMSEMGLVAKATRVQKKKRTTRSNQQHVKFDNVLNRQFKQDIPNTVWCGDITYISTDEGFLHLTVVLDLFNRGIVGWAMSHRMTAEQTTLPALRMAYKNRQPYAPLLFHSDRGSQYTCKAYQGLLNEFKIQPSMSRKGDCYDNAVVESFFHTLKVELIYDRKFSTRKEAELAIFEYIEVFYNRQRLHSTLNYKSPLMFEEEYLKMKNVS